MGFFVNGVRVGSAARQIAPNGAPELQVGRQSQFGATSNAWSGDIDDLRIFHRPLRGAEVTDLETAPIGDRRFTATDPEGQVWVFAQRVEDPSS
jgi:uncharacterized glyoxalase superfamily protein PhnB